MSDQENAEEQPQQRIINIDQAQYMEWGKGERYEAKLGPLAHVIGAAKLGFNITRLAPGKAARAKRPFPITCITTPKRSS